MPRPYIGFSLTKLCFHSAVCKDAERESNRGLCKSWAKSGFCLSSKNIMKKYCSKECKYCSKLVGCFRSWISKFFFYGLLSLAPYLCRINIRKKLNRSTRERNPLISQKRFTDGKKHFSIIRVWVLLARNLNFSDLSKDTMHLAAKLFCKLSKVASQTAWDILC